MAYLEFGITLVQRGSTTRTFIHTWFIVLIIFACSGPFSSFLTEDPKLDASTSQPSTLKENSSVRTCSGESTVLHSSSDLVFVESAMILAVAVKVRVAV